MNKPFVSRVDFPESAVWKKIDRSANPIFFDLEITARCNNNCRHCFINLPACDTEARRKELALDQIKKIAGEAADAGAIWCLLTGGEPLLREDFFDIYLAVKKAGLLITLFTNATLLTDDHINFFRKYPPRDVEVTVYGITQETYEKVTRVPGSFHAFMRGLNLLLANNIPIRLKAIAMRSNAHELSQIAAFCRERTRDFFRFDPFLHLRYNGDAMRNAEIVSERLSPEEIISIEKADEERFSYLKKACNRLIIPKLANATGDRLFRCRVGHQSFVVSYDGYFRLCSALWHPDCVFDLKKGSLRDALKIMPMQIKGMRVCNENLLKTCHKCPIVNLCLYCPAHAHLETGKLDESVEYFCKVAHARAELLSSAAVHNA